SSLRVSRGLEGDLEAVIFPTEQPKVLLVFSLIALVVAAGIGAIAYADQHKRIDDPVRYAELRCEGAAAKSEQSSSAFDRCVAREKSKSTVASIFPLLLIGAFAFAAGVVGVAIGRVEVRKAKELEAILRDDPEP